MTPPLPPAVLLVVGLGSGATKVTAGTALTASGRPRRAAGAAAAEGDGGAESAAPVARGGAAARASDADDAVDGVAPEAGVPGSEPEAEALEEAAVTAKGPLSR